MGTNKNLKFSSPILKTIQKEMKSLIFAILLTSMVACTSRRLTPKANPAEQEPQTANHSADDVPDLQALSEENCGKCAPSAKAKCTAFVKSCVEYVVNKAADKLGFSAGALLGKCIGGNLGAVVGAGVGVCIPMVTAGCIAGCKESKPVEEARRAFKKLRRAQAN